MSYFCHTMFKQKKALLLTGSNMGDRLGYLLKANELIREKIGAITKSSGFYETEAWGNLDHPDYINQALEVLTPLSPSDLLHEIFEIEKQLGRLRRCKWESRVIDIDILFYENKIVNTEGLKLPHPLLHKRNFVLVPLLEIAPMKKHPVFKKTIEELYEETEDNLEVYLLETE